MNVRIFILDMASQKHRDGWKNTNVSSEPVQENISASTSTSTSYTNLSTVESSMNLGIFNLIVLDVFILLFHNNLFVDYFV